MLLRELLRDPHLTDYSVVIVDEAHERTLRTDMLLCVLRQLQLTRTKGPREAGNLTGGSRPPPLKLVIMSASLDAEHFSQYFHGCVRARIHPKAQLFMFC
jgi:HrpA-like RNA helicase